MAQYRKSYQRRLANGDSRPDSYQLISDRFVQALEEGRTPWREPWIGGAVGLPRNMNTGRPYRGTNTLLLWMTSHERGYASPYWATINQINDLGGHVRAGETRENGRGATWITKWGDFTPRDAERDPETGEAEKRRYLRVFKVFNAMQCVDLPARFYPQPRTEVEASEEAEAAVAAYQAADAAPGILHDVHGEAYYLPRPDKIHLPARDEHTGTAEYYSTLFHELGHASGHPSRLGRPGIKLTEQATGHTYGEEELVAEIAAAMLCAETGVATPGSQRNSEAYVTGWAAQIKGDKKLIVHAAAAAQLATSLVLEPSRSAQPDAGTGAQAEPADAVAEPADAVADADGIEAA